MVLVSIKMRDGASYQTQLETSLEDAEKFVFNGSPFIRLAYDNGWIYLALSDVSTVIGAEGKEQAAVVNDILPEVINE